MDGWMDVRMYGCTDGWTDGWQDGLARDDAQRAELELGAIIHGSHGHRGTHGPRMILIIIIIKPILVVLTSTNDETTKVLQCYSAAVLQCCSATVLQCYSATVLQCYYYYY